MTSKENILPDEKARSVPINLGEIYSFDAKDVTVDVSTVRYSNLAYINVSHRDVHIDFLEMPGIKKDNKVLVNGTRIYMSHVAAQRLAEALEEILERLHSGGEMEVYGDIKSDEKST